MHPLTDFSIWDTFSLEIFALSSSCFLRAALVDFSFLYCLHSFAFASQLYLTLA